MHPFSHQNSTLCKICRTLFCVITLENSLFSRKSPSLDCSFCYSDRNRIIGQKWDILLDEPSINFKGCHFMVVKCLNFRFQFRFRRLTKKMNLATYRYIGQCHCEILKKKMIVVAFKPTKTSIFYVFYNK